MMQERKEKEIRFKNDIQHPLVSIITVVLNGESHLEHTINSVLCQTYENLEYILRPYLLHDVSIKWSDLVDNQAIDGYEPYHGILKGGL